MGKCPTCNGHGQVYQTEATLDGGFLPLDDKKSIAVYGGENSNSLRLCTCPRCNGSGQIEKNEQYK